MNEFQVVNKSLYEIKQEILVDYNGEFEMVGNLKVDDQIRQIYIRFRNITDYEAYINAIDQDYEAEEALFNGYVNKSNTPQVNLVKRSQYGNGCDFKHEIIEYRVINCFIPTKGSCFIKCVNFSTGEDYKQQYIDFIRTEKNDQTL